MDIFLNLLEVIVWRRYFQGLACILISWHAHCVINLRKTLKSLQIGNFYERLKLQLNGGDNMKTIEKLLMILGFVGVLTFSMFAQTPTGTIEGIVTDPQGAVVQGATVGITDVATGRTVTVTSNEEGLFTVRSLTPGRYTVKIEKEGFNTATVENVVVQVG